MATDMDSDPLLDPLLGLAPDDVWAMFDSFGFGNSGSGEKTHAARRPAEAACCEKCASDQIEVQEGMYVCMSCQVVQERMIDMGAEWRFYGADEHRDGDPSRCGLATNPLLPKSSLGSIIGGRRNDSLEMRRIRRYQMWNSMPHYERQLLKMFDHMNNNTQNQGIPSKVLDDAYMLYTEASQKKISRGENKEGLLASCIFYACILNKIPRSSKEIARMFRIDPLVLTKGNSRFQALLRMKMECSNPDDFIPRFGSRLNMDYNDLQTCRAFTKRIDDLDLISENAPTSVAAGALFHYCQMRKFSFTKRQIADVCDVSEVTITKCHKRMQRFQDVLDEAWKEVCEPRLAMAQTGT